MAPELEEKQTIENLYAFGARLETEYQKMLTEKSRETEYPPSSEKPTGDAPDDRTT